MVYTCGPVSGCTSKQLNYRADLRMRIGFNIAWRFIPLHCFVVDIFSHALRLLVFVVCDANSQNTMRTSQKTEDCTHSLKRLNDTRRLNVGFIHRILIVVVLCMVSINSRVIKASILTATTSLCSYVGGHTNEIPKRSNCLP